MTKRVPLPEPVARIYKATAALEALIRAESSRRTVTSSGPSEKLSRRKLWA